MKYIFVLLLLTLNLFSKEVLLIHSYHKGYIWSDDISKSIEEKLKPYENIELTTVYMDTKRVAGPIYLDKLASLYKDQFQKRKFDLIIASDNNAFDFVIRYHDYLFKDLPVLFCGINNFDKNLLYENNMNKYMTGVVEQVDLEKNFELILKLHPKMKNLLILNDKSKTGLAMRRDLRAIIKKYKKIINIEYIDNMDIEKIEEKVSKLTDDTIILYVLLFKDKTGKYFSHKKSFQQIKKKATVPIYGLWDFYLNYGIVGGLLTSALSQGDAVSEMALDILLRNKKIKDIPILEKSPNRYIFDYKELQKFDIDIEPFVKDYILINEPSTIYKEYTKFVVLSLISIFILSVMVLSMRANIQRRKVMAEDLQNIVRFDRVLLNTMPSPIYYKNRNGKLLGCNEAFSTLFSMEKKDVIGKTAHDFYPYDLAVKNENIDKELFKTQGTNNSELTLHFPNGSMKNILLNKAVYLNSDGSIGGIVCIMDDITERLQQKQFLIQQGKLAEMGDMIAAIAHQWNEPLVELSAQVQDIQTSYLLEDLQKVHMDDFVNDSMVQIKYMSKTLSDFRNFLKPSTKRTLFSIKNSFDEIFEIVGKQLFYSNISTTIEYNNEKKELLIYGFENEFKQVLLNIINNAKNKILEKETNEKFKLTIKINSDETYNIIEIIDDGGIIDEKIINSIFDPYFTTKEEGTGFGLYMAKVIIEDKMMGNIRVHNHANLVVFTIKIPHIIGEENENITS
ncbi:MAG: PAS domain-containing protein [Campylobacteraceae bacterium]|nr:PAS domain-containing protein [Campylobacteraceae bacterium]